MQNGLSTQTDYLDIFGEKIKIGPGTSPVVPGSAHSTDLNKVFEKIEDMQKNGFTFANSEDSDHDTSR